MAKRKAKVITNTALLQAAIDRSGKNPTTLAAEWGVSVPTYYSRIYGNSEFTASEICAAVKSLRLNRTERGVIFLADSVSENHKVS